MYENNNLEERVRELEGKIEELSNFSIALQDLPLAQLRRHLFTTEPWDPREFLLPKSVDDDLLANKGIGTAETLKMIRGVIGTTGPSTTAGSGFSLTRNAAGDVTVTFTQPFASVPAVVPVAEQSGSARFAEIVSVAANNVRILRMDSAGTGQDGSLHFIAIGNR